MAKFLKNLFSTSSMKIKQEKTEEEAPKEIPTPFDTKRTLSISRSGRMKQNLKNRGKLNGELFGDETPKSNLRSTEYRVNKRDFFDNEPAEPPTIEKDDKKNNDVNNDADAQRRLGNVENHNQSNHKLDSIDSSTKNANEHNHTIYNDEADDESADMAVFDKDIEQILQFKESDF
ncbi:uncharacterized protein LOC143918916 [Arctopsyche grandis]|uniref:uncharacterized protein LOC143918916 n=1 Tax=Arctopsyche grandis TaxID=121162 RepID=UPI00406D8279